MRPPYAVALLLAAATPLRAQEPAPIQDNSFLIEEAYNQEARVVQHINAFQRSSGGAWWYTFTQEWPLFGQHSQLSYTIPFVTDGFGDIALNYRMQLGGTDGRVAVSPRVSMLFPTGDELQGRGRGVAAMQLNLPVSVRVAPRVVTHWNAGATLTAGATGTSTDLAAGASAIWEVRPTFNALVELVWARAGGVEELFLNPGIRWAHNVGGLQIVPGIGVPIGLGPSKQQTAVFLYLSLEHAF